MKLFNRKVKDLEEQIKDREKQLEKLIRENSVLFRGIRSQDSTIEGLREEIKELKNENVDLLDRLRKVLKEAVEHEADTV